MFPHRHGRIIELAGIVLLTLAVPLLIPALTTGGSAPPRLPYLPVFEGTRENAFAAHRLEELRRLNPGFVVIGDSMAGTRVDERLLGRLAGRPVAPLLQAGSGSVLWYLMLKNWVVASGIQPKAVFIFFRDTNLTDPMFRLDDQYRWALDFAAGDEVEEEVNAVIEARLGGGLSALHRRVEHAYDADRLRRRAEPAVARWPLEAITASRRRQAALQEQANARFALDRLRPMEAADVAADEGTDFSAEVDDSVLPLMLRDASRAGLRLCFVRVQRRPSGGRPPAQSAALRRYVQDLREYVEGRGAVFHDDTGDPAMTIDLYGDGDHIAFHARETYSALFFHRLASVFK